MKSGKLLVPSLLLLIFSFQLQAQWIHKSFDFENISRDYWVYVPSGYNPSDPIPLVVTLHGMGDNDTNFRDIGFNLVADTANFIVLVPNAVPFNSSNPIVQGIIGGSRTWNSGAGVIVPVIGEVIPNSEINDVGFINKMVDATVDDYSIDEARIYLCGFSMGGFMTQRMAIESNGRYAAFATAAGTIGTELVNPNPGRAIPLAHFNGTVDEKVNWQSGNPLFQIYVDSMVTFWIDNNNCDPSPIHTLLPDTNPTDGYTVEHDVYPNGNDGSVLEVFKVNGAGHVWLGFNNDISYTLEMWKFFSRFSFQTAGTSIESFNKQFNMHPNPAKETVKIQFSNEITEPYMLTLFDMEGREVIQFQDYKKNTEIQIDALKTGIYLLNIKNTTMNITKRLVVE